MGRPEVADSWTCRISFPAAAEAGHWHRRDCMAEGGLDSGAALDLAVDPGFGVVLGAGLDFDACSPFEASCL